MRPDTTPCSSRGRCDGVARAVAPSRTALAFCVSFWLAFADAHSARAGTQYFPGDGEFGSILCEESWPFAGDLDHNDLAVRFNTVATVDEFGGLSSLQYAFDVHALGADLPNGLALRLPIAAAVPYVASLTVEGSPPVDLSADPDESQLVLVVADDVRADLCDGAPGFLNTDPALPESDACHPAVLQISFPVPPPIDIALLPFDLYVFRAGDRSLQIHRPEYAGTDTMNTALFGTGDDASLPGGPWFVDPGGIPFLLLEPASFAVPVERTSITSAYPDIVGFGASGGATNQDWYLHPVPSRVYGLGAHGLPVGPMVAPAFALLALATAGFRSRR